MTIGAVIFAYNNEKIDYVRLAQWSANNIRRHLDIPVCLITDQAPKYNNFDKIVYTEKSSVTNSRHFSDVGHVTWHNLNRMSVYDLTPWDQTLVLDADYVVASNQLKTLFDIDQDFMCHKNAYDVTGKDTFEGLNVFGKYRFPMWWATVMMFRKSEQAKIIFDSMQMIQTHWTHYRRLYSNNQPTYRNDHALSIALGIETGHTLEVTDIPWELASLTPDHGLVQTAQDCYRIDFVDSQNRARWIELKNQDFHAMGKQHLGDIVANNT